MTSRTKSQTASFAALGSETAGSNPHHNAWLEKKQGMSTWDTKHCFKQRDHVDEQLYCHKSHSKIYWKHSDKGAGTLFVEDCSLPALWPDLTVQKPKVLGHHKLRCVDCSHSCGRKKWSHFSFHESHSGKSHGRAVTPGNTVSLLTGCGTGKFLQHWLYRQWKKFHVC